MIINHKYKFIFIKTTKTAGTSLEIALSQFCGSHDVITAISDVDEKLRQQFGFPGPQNYKLDVGYFKKKDWLQLFTRGQWRQFRNHCNANFVRENIDREIWNSYFKFCFERNPFDKAISRYYWSTKDPRPAIEEYLKTCPRSDLSNWEAYTINDQIAVDFVGRYENLEDDLTMISEKIGLNTQLTLPRAKGGHRKNKQHYSNVLSKQARARIECVCAKEIATFNYGWSSPKKNKTCGLINMAGHEC